MPTHGDKPRPPSARPTTPDLADQSVAPPPEPRIHGDHPRIPTDGHPQRRRAIHEQEGQQRPGAFSPDLHICADPPCTHSDAWTRDRRGPHKHDRSQTAEGGGTTATSPGASIPREHPPTRRPPHNRQLATCPKPPSRSAMSIAQCGSVHTATKATRKTGHPSLTPMYYAAA